MNPLHAVLGLLIVVVAFLLISLIKDDWNE